jgi:hypothetical protein
MVARNLAAGVGERGPLLLGVRQRQRVVIVLRDLAGGPSRLRQPFARRCWPQFGYGAGAASGERFALALLGGAHSAGGDILRVGGEFRCVCRVVAVGD